MWHPPRLLAALLLLAGIVFATTSHAQTPLPGFTDTVVLGNVASPTAIRFSPDGRVFVAEKQGMVKVFQTLSTAFPVTAVDISSQVHNFWDRGLIGLALDPNFPATPYIYVLYTYNAPPGGTAPTWNACPTPPGALGDGCVVTGRLSKFQVDAQNQQVGDEQVLISGKWCQQFPSHSVGSLVFGADGALYVSGGEGANFASLDYGQYGGSPGSPTQANPCGDPPGSVGTPLSPPNARGGALRSQRVISPVLSDPALYDGAILRVDPNTGLALPTNPLFNGPRAGEEPIVAFGLRNPLRMTVRPGTNEIWLGDVGWGSWEEINRIPDPTAPVLRNFGWPCYEGPLVESAMAAAGVTLCENLYNGINIPSHTAYTGPYFTYHHDAKVIPGESCPTGGSSVTALAFYTGGSYPAEYNGALFFGDYTRNCMWVMMPGAGGLPDPANVQPFLPGAVSPVDLQVGPGGDLFYVDFQSWAIHRIQYTGSNTPPVAVISANPTIGDPPLLVSFDGSGSFDPDAGDSIASYSWDLNGDGTFGDSTDVAPTFVYAVGSHVVSLRVTDEGGLTHTAQVTIQSGNTPPVATILTPSASLAWIVDQPIEFSGEGTDAEDGTLPASAMQWTVLMHHCPSNCHVHEVQVLNGVTGGTFPAPDHEYPSHLEIQLRVVDSGNAVTTTSVLLYPTPVDLSFQTVPTGLDLGVGQASEPTPFTRTVIVGSRNSVSAPSPQITFPTGWLFTDWSDGGAQTHDVIAGPTPSTYTANFVQCVGPIPTLSEVLPTSQNVGGAIAVSGTGFGPTSVIRFDGAAAPTALLSDRLMATVPSAPVGHMFSLTVQHPQGCPSQELVTVTVLEAPPSGCGLLGIEALVPLVIVGAWRRRTGRSRSARRG